MLMGFSVCGSRQKQRGSARPGQFISMYTNDGSKLLPRPISICEIDKEGGKTSCGLPCNRGKTGTEEFSQMKAGDTIPVIGPLGNGFPFEKAEGKKVFDGRRNRCAADPGACKTDEM